MSVYDKNGSALNSLYSIEDSVKRAYDVNGAIVFDKTYDDYTIITLYTLGVNNCQGIAVYDDVLFQFRASGNVITDKVSLFTYSTGNTIYTDMECKADHGDSATFSDEFYSASDEFPLLYVTADTTPALIYVDRINRSSSSLVRTLKFPASAGYYGAGAFDFQNNICWLLAYSKNNYKTDDGGTNKTVVSKWDLSNLTANGDSTYTPAFIGQYERDFIYVMQGLTYHDGIIWISSGYPSHNAYVYGMNPDTGVIEHTIDFNTTTEIEACQFIYDSVTQDWYMLAGFQGGLYKKVTFN